MSGEIQTEEMRGEISLRLLSIFAALMGGSTTKEAAEQLGISQPAISSGIRQLEAILGVNLFERLHRRLQPTEEAYHLFSEIKPVFPILRGFEIRARAMRLGLFGRLRVLSTPPIGHTVGALALGRLLEERPEVTVSYDVRRLEEVIEAVQNGSVDIGLGLGLDSHPNLAVDIMARVGMVCLIPASHACAGHGPISAAELTSHDVIGLEAESSLGQAVRQAFQRDGVPYTPRVEVRYCATAAVLGAATGVIAIVDPFTATLRQEGQVVRTLAPACEVQVVLLTRRGVPQSKLVKSYIAFVRSAVRGIPACSRPCPSSASTSR